MFDAGYISIRAMEWKGDITKYVKADAANTVSIVVTVVGIVISCVDIVKNVFNDVFNNREEWKNPPDFRGILPYNDILEKYYYYQRNFG